MSSSSQSQATRRRGAGLVVLTCLAYLPVLRAGFVWDDDTFVWANPLIHARDGLAKFWFTGAAPDYWPVTSSSLWLEWRLWGMHAAGYHAVNLALHAIAALLLWRVLQALALPGAWFAALLFAVHPMNVESVAWIAERKNVLAMVFGLLAALAYLRGRPWLGLGAFVLGMLSKGAIAFFPPALALLLGWRRRFTRADALRLAVFLAVAAALVVVDIRFQGRHAPGLIRTASPAERVLGAGAVIWFYLGKAVLPIGQCFIYPQWHVRTDDLLWWLPLGAAVATTALLWRYSRPGFVAWAYFVLALVPVLGLTDVYFMKFSLVADHYAYWAIIAVAAVAAARLPRAASVGIAAVFAVLTWRQCGQYRDAETLYRTVLARNSHAWLADNNLGRILESRGDLAGARDHYLAALRSNPRSEEAETNLGRLASSPEEAGAHYRRAIADNPDYAEARNNLGNVDRALGRWDEARDDYQQALRINPTLAGAENGLGLVAAAKGQFAAALEHYSRALQLMPEFAAAHRNAALVLANERQFARAVSEFQAAVRLDPADFDSRRNLAVALAQDGHLAEAAQTLKDLLRVHPDPEAEHDLQLIESHR